MGLGEDPWNKLVRFIFFIKEVSTDVEEGIFMQFGRKESESDLRTKLLGALLVTILSTTVGKRY